jgi:3-oxoacyl-[acyl-carrier protein] reductase
MQLPDLSHLISLKGKRALITGAAAGIGRAIGYRFAEANADLDLVDIDSAALCEARQELSCFGGKVDSHVVDLSCKEEIDALWLSLPGQGPDILVNNAGIYPFKSFLDADDAFSQRVMQTNLFSVYRMCQHMIRLRRKIGGIIINLGSIEAVLSFKEDLSSYSMSKAGVIALTRALAKEHARHGFRVNAILPGGIITRGTKAVARQLLRFRFGLLKTGYEFSQRLPARRAGKADEIARMALVLASDLASYVHGATIPVDGGFLAA